MRIAFVLPSFPTVSETFIYSQINELIDRGHEVKILAFRKNTTLVNHQILKDYCLLELCDFYPRFSLQRLYGEFRFFFRKVVFESFLFNKNYKSEIKWLHLIDYFNYINVNKWLLENPHFDIIHIHFGLIGIPFVKEIEQRKIDNTKLVVTFHGVDLDPSRLNSFKEIYHNLFAYADSLTVNSPYLHELLSSICEYKDKIHILPVGLDTIKFNNKGQNIRREDEIFKIVFCGKLIELKGPDIAIKTIDYLQKERGIKNIQLRIIGSGPMKESLNKLIINLRLQEKVFLIGNKSQEELKIEMSESHLFILPGIHDIKTNRAETQGLVIQEAQSMELPVLVSDAGGMKYGLLDEISGFVVKQNDIKEFANKIEYLINNELIRQKMARAGRLFVSQNYDIRLIVNRLEKIYLNKI